ncbi:Uncharacterised protein [uncultured archaeon]|nr:Uncharacterised protein [uncultured archaeon]
MTRSFIGNMSSWLKSAFSAKVFGKKADQYSHKVKTPRSYYRAKARQQARGTLELTPSMKRDYMASKSKKKR